MTVTFTPRLSCDHCGDDQAELRTCDNDGWCADDVLCAACFTGRDPEGSFTDHKLAQEAAQ